MSKTKILGTIPVHHVMAFNAVSAPAYIGQAAALNVDGSLDDEPDFGVIIVCKTQTDLERFFAHIGQPINTKLTKEVAVASTDYLRVMKQAAITDGSHGQLNPNHKDLDHDEL